MLRSSPVFEERSPNQGSREGGPGRALHAEGISMPCLRLGGVAHGWRRSPAHGRMLFGQVRHVFCCSVARCKVVNSQRLDRLSLGVTVRARPGSGDARLVLFAALLRKSGCSILRAPPGPRSSSVSCTPGSALPSVPGAPSSRAGPSSWLPCKSQGSLYAAWNRIPGLPGECPAFVAATKNAYRRRTCSTTT